MNLAYYYIHFRIEWRSGGTTTGSWEHVTDEIYDLFPGLKEEVYLESLKNPFTGEQEEPPENIRKISISIWKQREL